MRSLSYTKVTVHLRKSTLRNEWYVYLESYPVYVKDKEGPQRIREYFTHCTYLSSKPGDNYNVLPIPKEEIDYCGGVLIQNPGY